MTSPKRRWTTPEKVLAAIILGLLFWLLFGSSPQGEDLGSPSQQPVILGTFPPAQRPVARYTTDLKWLQDTYRYNNQAYFQSRLPQDTIIELDQSIQKMGDTNCLNDAGLDCTIRLNLDFNLAPRTADLTLQHEMCHIEAWSKTLRKDVPRGILESRWDHNRFWRGCMAKIEAEDAFRNVLIDYYGDTI